jgi:ABC-type oligopeptide transport system substrate-binding subunit
MESLIADRLRWVILVALLALTACSQTKFSERETPTKETAYVWLTRYDVKTLDPAAIQDWTTGRALSYMFPSIGQLAKEIYPDAKEPKQIWIALGDHKFSNGDPVTTADVAFTLKRCLVPDVQSGVGNQFASQILGAQEFMDGKAKEVAGITIVDAKSMRIELVEPDGAYIKKLSNTALGVVNQKLVGLQPIIDHKPGYGAGYYTLEDFEVLRFWKLKHIKTGEKIKFQFVGDSATRRNLYDTGQADYAMFAPHEINVVRGHKDLSKGGPTTMVYLQLNPKTQPAFDMRVRMQMRGDLMGVDFPELLGGMVTRTQFESGYVPLGQSTAPAKPDIAEPDLSKSKDKIVFSGTASFSGGAKPPSLPLEITFAEIGMQNPAVEAIITALKQKNWKIQGRAMQSGVMLEKNAKGEIPILFTGWQPDFEGALNTIPMLFHSKSSENHSGFSDPRVDQLVEKAQAGEEPEEFMSQANAIIRLQTPIIPLYIQRDLVLTRREPPK